MDHCVEDPTDASSVVRFQCRRLKKNWTSRIINITLTLVYLVQAITTIILSFRRSTLSQRIPQDGPFANMDTKPIVTITPFEYQALSLCIHGIFISVIYIVLQSFPVQWIHLDNGREWNYIPGSRKDFCSRIALGYFTSAAVLATFLSALKISDSLIIFDFSGTITFRSLWYIFLAILGVSAVKYG